MSWLAALLWASWNVLLVAAPFVLLGLLTAGLLHVVLSRHVVARWMGREGLSGVVAASLFGIPLPLCSCGVVPVALTLRRKGASRPAAASFLISTPETGVDSILLTWGMLGPLMAVVRPLAAFLTAVLAGIGIIALGEEDRPAGAASGRAVHADHGHDHEDEAHVVGAMGLWRAICVAVAPRSRAAAAEAPARPLEQVMTDVVRYASIDLLDDVVFWLVIGIVLAGGVSLLVPDDLAARGLGGGLGPMLLALVVGVPLYICASASTPVAAALVAKGVSPGTVLVFLLAGPATNAATIVLLSRHFGARFVQVYLASIAVAALACGLALDALLALTGWSVMATLSGGLGGVALVQWLSAAVLVALMAWRLWAGAGRRGVQELVVNVDSTLRLAFGDRAIESRAWWRTTARRAVVAGIAAAVVAWAASGVRVVPLDGRGYGFLFGRMMWPDLGPGLHYVPPWPFGRVDVWRVSYSRLAAVGFRPDLEAVANRRRLTRQAGADLWHSPITASRSDPQMASFLTGDENLLEISFAVIYGLSDPTAYFYQVDKDRDSVRLYAESMAREFVATRPVDELLTTGRAELERVVAARLQAHLDRVGAGVRIDAVLVVDLHPPQGAVSAFRAVAGAREERQTAINGAAAEQAREIPLARGAAATTLASATAAAAGAEIEARGRADAFLAKAAAYRQAPKLLGELMWLENAERVLAGREKLLVPPGGAGGHLALWRTAPGVVPAVPPSAGEAP